MSMRVPLPQSMVFGKYLSRTHQGRFESEKKGEPCGQNTVAGITVWTLALLSLVAHSTPVRPTETRRTGMGAGIITSAAYSWRAGRQA